VAKSAKGDYMSQEKFVSREFVQPEEVSVAKEKYASLEDSTAFLLELGFIPVEGVENTFDSPGEDQYGLPVVQPYLYPSCAGYWCVDLDTGFRAPCIWNGPKADWDTTETKEEFVKWLDTYHPGWK
jgi:hypothetical protein